jgi:hypothetical protein
VVVSAALVHCKCVSASEIRPIYRPQILLSHWNRAPLVVVSAALVYRKTDGAGERYQIPINKS